MATQSQLPGNLNLIVKRGDDFATTVDFDVDITGYTVSSSISSLVTFAEVSQVTTSVLIASLGQVSISIPRQQTLLLAPGSYGWSMQWKPPSGGERSILGGVVEVIR